MLADLTRFDFNAHDFLNSETVETMTDAEVGQYILLLAKSWLMAKGASLPNDSALLARWAHCQKVSSKVMEKFPLTDTPWGMRHRNNRLYSDWCSACERSESASERGIKGNEVRWGNRSSDGSSDGSGDALGIAKGIAQTKPNQINPNQTNPNQSNFKNLSHRFRNAFGFKPGKREKEENDYSEACRAYGEDWVLEQFEIWVQDNQWVKERKAKFPLSGFYEELSELKESAELQSKKTETQGVAGVSTTYELVDQRLKEIQSESAEPLPLDQF